MKSQQNRIELVTRLVVEQVYAGILENVASNANLIAFPEIAVPLVSQLRTFVKTCQVSNYTKKVKQLLDKVRLLDVMSHACQNCG